MSNAFEGLNDLQLKVASAIDGKFLVLAGAGSGKTRVLTKRIKYLIEDVNIQPYNILAISFTKKASNEIKDRLKKDLGQKALDINMGTFHAVCARILLPNIDRLPEKYLIKNNNDVISLEPQDVNNIIKDFAKNYGYNDKKDYQEICSKIGYLGNYGIHPLDTDMSDYPKDIVSIYTDYVEYKRNCRYIDFNDLLYYTKVLLNNNPDLVVKYSKMYKYVLVDECQDLNDIQFELTKMFSSFHQNYMMIGDDKQTIYSWRGSNVKNMINLSHLDNDLTVLYLKQNYRSTKNIVNSANHLISYNKKQLDNNAISEREDGSPVFIYNAPDNIKEADFVADMIKGFITEKGFEYSDFAVIYRNNSLSTTTQMALRSASIPYNVFGGREFYDRFEIKTLIYYLRAVINQNDNLAFENIINVPKRGIGTTSIDRIKMFSEEGNIPFYVAMENIVDIPKINNPSKKKITDLCSLINKWKISHKTHNSVYELTKEIINDTNFMSQYAIDKTEDEKIVENIVELTNLMMNYELNQKHLIEEGQSMVSGFLSDVNLSFSPKDELEKDELNKVTLTTVHSSKGLEFKVVFLIGVENKVFPGKMVKNDDELEEERRAMYVGMTRAEDILFISYADKRVHYSKIEDTGPSLFIKELPKDNILYIDYSI